MKEVGSEARRIAELLSQVGELSLICVRGGGGLLVSLRHSLLIDYTMINYAVSAKAREMNFTLVLNSCLRLCPPLFQLPNDVDVESLVRRAQANNDIVVSSGKSKPFHTIPKRFIHTCTLNLPLIKQL